MLHTYKWNPKIDFFSWNFWKFQTELAGHGACKHHLACDVHPALCQILCHLNNARWINGPQVAIWGWRTCMHDHRLTSYLNFESGRIGRERLFFMFIIFNGQYLTQRCNKWRFKKIWAILNDELWFLEALVKLWLTRAFVNSVYETFRLVQMVFNLWSQCVVPSYHHVL